MRIIDVGKIWEDGEHNAFTDLCYWSDRYWLCFRHSRNHVTSPAKIYVLCSENGQRWEKVGEIAEEGVDLRDPKWLLRDDELFIYMFRYKPGAVETTSYRTHDGRSWHQREPRERMDFALWRPIKVDDGYYVAGQGGRIRLLFSPDGVSWQHVSEITSKDRPTETSLGISPDGTMVAVIRREPENDYIYAMIARAKPPYTAWECHLADRFLAGTVLRPVDGRFLVAGRCVTAEPYKSREDLRTGVFWLEGASLVPAAILPSGKDTSYPGMVLTGKNTALLSYYSGHEYENGCNLVWIRGSGSKQERQTTSIYRAKLAWSEA